MNQIKTLTAIACFSIFGVLFAPTASHANCSGKLKIVNNHSTAIIIKYIALDMKRDKGTAWVKAWEGNKWLTIKKGASYTLRYNQKLITNCNKASKRFQLTYKAQQGTLAQHVSSTNFKRGSNFTITRTGRKSFKLSSGT